MKPKEFLLTSSDAITDRVAAQTAVILRDELALAETGYSDDVQPLLASLESRFYGIGGAETKRAGVDMVCDWADPNAFKTLYDVALNREPDAVVCVGNSMVNVRLVHALKSYLRKHSGTFFNWEPKLIWVAWLPSVGQRMKEDFDCVVARQSHEETVALAGRAAHKIVELMMHELATFPLKAGLGS